MSWQVIVALVISIPVVLLPVAFVWYLNAGGIFAVVKEMRTKRVMQASRVDTDKGIIK